MAETKQTSFWQKPEGVTGMIFLVLAAIGGFYLTKSFLVPILAFLGTTVGIAVSMALLGTIIFLALDGKSRALISYLYKSVMRWITGLFIKIDPISILKNYIGDLKSNLTAMNRQIAKLRAQMHKLKEMMYNNQKQIDTNLTEANAAKDSNEKNQMILKSRKAGRLQESNLRLDQLYNKMEILYRVLTKMYENSSIMAEDIEDQVLMKEQERIAIMASHSAMKSAMNIIKGDNDKRAMFDSALEAIADDVSQKVGEMEQFMTLSENFMQSIDLQNGVFEEEGLKMLEKWEHEGISVLLGNEKQNIINKANDDDEVLDLNSPIAQPEKVGRKNQYDSFFE